MLHTDLFYEISLHCEPYLFSVNKELNLLYNDDWFMSKLQYLFPNRKLFTTTNYKDLYKKYLQEGDIYYLLWNSSPRLKIRGIKAQYCDKDYSGHGIEGDYILTFNGELYLQNNDNVVLVDIEVIDISSWGYIKKHTAYFSMTDGKITELTFKEELVKIICYGYDVYILSVDGLYVINEQMEKFFHKGKYIDIFLSKDIYAIDENNEYYRVLDEKIIHDNSFKQNMDPNVKKYLDIWKGNIRLLKNGLLIKYTNNDDTVEYDFQEIDNNVRDIIVDNEDCTEWYYIK